jgi:arabinan endo-1,5-alpha-L-arabinosidase
MARRKSIFGKIAEKVHSMAWPVRVSIAIPMLLNCFAVSQQQPSRSLIPQNRAQAPVQTPDHAPAAAPPTGRRLEPPPGGMPFVHDPSTVIRYRDKYYVYTTGRGIPMLSSPDLVNWSRLGSVFPQIPERVHAAVPKNNGVDVWAPDIVRIGKTFFLYYAVSSWGSFRSAVALAINTTLDPADPAYRWVDRGVVVASDGIEEMNAIDPGIVLAPDGTMWLCYGSYRGAIKVLQLDPKTGLALAGGNAKAGAVTVARESEAADIIVHGGYFYLFVNHGSCCQGKNSEYNIRVGRSRSVTGPYLDKHDIALTAGGGSLFLAAHDHRIGPGHFGRIIEETGESQSVGGEGMERFSLHYEADLSNLGRPTLGIRPLLWSTDGWPIAGDRLNSGVYQILSSATEDTLEVSVPNPAIAAAPNIAPHLGRYLAVEAQQWSIEPAGAGLYKLINLGTKGALSVVSAEDARLELSSEFTGADPQLWQMDQLTDGSYRILSKAAHQCLSQSKQGNVDLTPCVADDAHRWIIGTP